MAFSTCTKSHQCSGDQQDPAGYVSRERPCPGVEQIEDNVDNQGEEQRLSCGTAVGPEAKEGGSHQLSKAVCRHNPPQEGGRGMAVIQLEMRGGKTPFIRDCQAAVGAWVCSPVAGRARQTRGQWRMLRERGRKIIPPEKNSRSSHNTCTDSGSTAIRYGLWYACLWHAGIKSPRSQTTCPGNEGAGWAHPRPWFVVCPWPSETRLCNL